MLKEEVNRVEEGLPCIWLHLLCRCHEISISTLCWEEEELPCVWQHCCAVIMKRPSETLCCEERVRRQKLVRTSNDGWQGGIYMLVRCL